LLAVSSLSAAGGAERVISEMANWWADHGRQVGVLTLESRFIDHYRLHPDVERIPFGWRIPRTRLHIPAQFVKDQFMLRELALHFNPDVLVSFLDKINIRMLFALAGARVPIVVSERIDPRYHQIGSSWSLARRLLYPFAKALVVQTNSVTEWADRVVLHYRVRVVPNFVRAVPGPKESTTEEERIQPLILAVGRLDRQKGHDVLIRAFARTGAGKNGWHLAILGDGPERSNLEKLASDLGIGNAVSLPGIVKEPADWLYKSDFFVLSSRYEGFPNALLEAMACGCAVIAADCPSGPADIIRHDENGLLVPTENIEALSAAMVRLMGDGDLRTRLGHKALEVRSRFSQGKIMAKWDDLIESVCSL